MKKRWAVVCLGGLAIAALPAAAGTQQFYFNNIEQGPGSTSSPSITIVDGKPQGAQPAPAALESAPAPTVVENGVLAARPAAIAPAAVDTEAQLALMEKKRRRGGTGIRLVTAASGLRQDGDTRYGGALGLDLKMTRKLGFEVYGAGFAGSGTASADRGSDFKPLLGAELQFLPFRFGSGWGRYTGDFVELGFLAGASTLENPDHPSAFASPHLGAKLNLNLSEEWAITASARANTHYSMVQAGFSFLL